MEQQDGTAKPPKAPPGKRILPKDLRRLRRAARLGGNETSQSQNAEASVPQTPVVENPTNEQEEHVPASQDEPKPASPLPVPTMSRLQSFYSTDWKRQKLQHRTLVDVPTAFQLDAIPVDLVPKAKVVFLTPQPFPFLRPTSKIKQSAMDAFIGPNLAVDKPTAEIQWHRALQYFVHPGSALPPSVALSRMASLTRQDSSASNNNNNTEQAFYADRFHTWQTAFRDAYFGLRRSATESTIYVRSSECLLCFYNSSSPTASKSDSVFDVCRNYRRQLEEQAETQSVDKQETPDRSARGRISAVIVQSTARIRKDLHSMNVQYTVPFDRATKERETGDLHLLEQELEAMKKNSQAQAAASSRTQQHNVHGPDSLLLFMGHESVHGLYEFMINRKPLMKQDVPEIFSLRPFSNSSIRSLDVRYAGKMASSDNGAVMYRTEVSGFCHPFNLTSLVQALSDNAQQTFDGDDTKAVPVRAIMEPIAGAERMNSVLLDEQSAKVRSFLTLQERDARKQELEFASRRIDKLVVSLHKPMITIDVTSRMGN